MGALLFYHFWVMKVKLVNEKISLVIAVPKWHGLAHSITLFVFSLICCKYICDMAYANLTTYLLTRLPHVGPHNYNRRQIELFHLKWFNCG